MESEAQRAVLLAVISLQGPRAARRGGEQENAERTRTSARRRTRRNSRMRLGTKRTRTRRTWFADASTYSDLREHELAGVGMAGGCKALACLGLSGSARRDSYKRSRSQHSVALFRCDTF
eukprot:664638-Rhodomonas_salina.2